MLASPAQITLIKSLSTERAVSAEQAGFLARVFSGETTLTGGRNGTASRVITGLLALPKLPTRTTATTSGSLAPSAQSVPDTTEIPDGCYAVDTSDLDGFTNDVSFFRLNTNAGTGRWEGFRFLDQLASDTKYPVRNRQTKQAIFAKIVAAGVEESRMRYGQLIGRCGICNRTLTDDTSRAMGIGPECARNMGLARVERPAPAPAPVVCNDADCAGSCQDDTYVEYTIDESIAAERHAAVDKQGVPMGAGGWRARKAYAVEARSDERGARRIEADRPSSQQRVLKGTTWEDIFGMPNEFV